MSPTAAGIGVRSLTKTFGRQHVLDDLTVDFKPARVTALVGPNGAGKTTLLKCVLGLVHPTRGTVLLGASELDAEGRYRHGIGFMPQLPHFPARMSGWELAAMLDDLRGFSGDPDEELIDAFDLRADMVKPFRTLSGGTRQKVNAALAFRYGSRVLILDEPTAGLDPLASLALKRKIRAAREAGSTVVVTSHNLGDLEAVADDVVFLHEGRARFAGPLDDLLARTGRATLEEAIADLMREESIDFAQGVGGDRPDASDEDDRTGAPGEEDSERPGADTIRLHRNVGAA